MSGLAALAIAVAYIAFWWYVVRIAATRRGKIIAIAVAVIIPFWDLPIGYAVFANRCLKDGGLHVIEKIPPQKAVCADVGLGDPTTLLKAGFEVVEYRDYRGTTQYRLGENGALEKSSVDSPKVSSYCLSVTNSRPLSWGGYQQELLVSKVQSNSAIARYTSFEWHGLWWIPESFQRGGGFHCFGLRGNELLPALLKGAG